MNKTLKRISLISITVALVASFYGCHKKKNEEPDISDDPVIIDDPVPIDNPQKESRIIYSHLSQPLPYGDNEKIWIDDNDYYTTGYFGQCTWFAYGVFYGYYGYKPVDLTGMADSFAEDIVETYPRKFKAANQPVVGKDMCIVFSCCDDWGHTGVITNFDGTNITYMDGNIMQLIKKSELLDDDAICQYLDDGIYILARNTTHIHIDGEIANWRTVTTTYEKFTSKFPHTKYAIPK